MKISSVKFWFFEVGPFEITWPSSVGIRRILAALAVVIVLGGSGATYRFMIKPKADAAKGFMRRGEYARAVESLTSVSPKLRWWPGIRRALEQASFGARLAHESIQNLTPEVERLHSKYPTAADVLVFQGLSAYWVKGDTNHAIEFFIEATQRDPQHIFSYVLAAGRLTDQVYEALARGDQAGAHADLSRASDLLDRLQDRVQFAEELPEVSVQRAELLELQGDVDKAYATYARLSSTNVLSAVQAAMSSWRFPLLDQRVKRGLEAAQSALSRLEKGEPVDANPEGWLFRVGTEPVIVRGRIDKRCLTSRTLEISRSLVAIGASDSDRNAIRVPELGADCPHEASIGPIQDILCVQVLGAMASTLTSNGARTAVLDAWHAKGLRCDARLKAPAILPPNRVEQRTVREPSV